MKNQATAVLRQFFATHFPDHQAGWETFIQCCTYKQYPRHHLLVQADAQEQQLRFLVSGTVRVFYPHPERPANVHFYVAPNCISDVNAFLHQTPTTQAQQALTAVELLVIDRVTHQRLVQQYPCGQALLSKLFQHLYRQQEAREARYRTLDAEELYRHVVQQRPEWLQHIPQYHLASYLGVTPETLSRIRRRIS